MAKVFVYDSYTNKFYTYDLSENDAMPYSSGTTLRVREFRGSSNAKVLWTTVAAMEAWNLTRRNYGSGFGKAATAPPASTTPVWRLMSAKASAAAHAGKSTTLP